MNTRRGNQPKVPRTGLHFLRLGNDGWFRRVGSKSSHGNQPHKNWHPVNSHVPSICTLPPEFERRNLRRSRRSRIRTPPAHAAKRTAAACAAPAAAMEITQSFRRVFHCFRILRRGWFSTQPRSRTGLTSPRPPHPRNGGFLLTSHTAACRSAPAGDKGFPYGPWSRAAAFNQGPPRLLDSKASLKLLPCKQHW